MHRVYAFKSLITTGCLGPDKDFGEDFAKSTMGNTLLRAEAELTDWKFALNGDFTHDNHVIHRA